MADEQAVELRMDPGTLYREDTFTDRRVGVIRVMTPVTVDGSVDLGRKILYVGEAQLLSPVGALPITFEIDATSLGDAAEKFAEGAKVGVERAIRELQELRREKERAERRLEPLPVPRRRGRTFIELLVDVLMQF